MCSSNKNNIHLTRMLNYLNCFPIHSIYVRAVKTNEVYVTVRQRSGRSLTKPK